MKKVKTGSVGFFTFYTVSAFWLKTSILVQNVFILFKKNELTISQVFVKKGYFKISN